jgi:hypothetical protein
VCVHVPRSNHGRRRNRVGVGAGCTALERLGLLRVRHVRGVGAAGVVAKVGATDGVVLRAAQDWAAVPSSAILGGAPRSAGGEFVAELLGHYHLAVLARVRVRVEGAAGSAAAEAAVGRGEAGEVRVVGG